MISGRHLSSLKTAESIRQNISFFGESKIDIECGKLHFPLFIKPRWGMGSISVYEADNLQELEILLLKVKRNIRNNYLKYEAAQDETHDVIIQEKLMGTEYGIDIINDLMVIIKRPFAS